MMNVRVLSDLFSFHIPRDIIKQAKSTVVIPMLGDPQSLMQGMEDAQI